MMKVYMLPFFLELLLTDREEVWCYLQINTTVCKVNCVTQFPVGYVFMVWVCYK